MSASFGHGNDDNDIIEILNSHQPPNTKSENDQDDIQLINRDSFDNIPESSGLTPILSPSDFMPDHQLIHPRAYTNNYNNSINNNNSSSANVESLTGTGNLPPLAPLSESVLPSSLLHMNLPITLPTEYGDKKKKKDPPIPKTRPAFVMKIWSMVNDPANAEYIQWNDDGKTFQVFHREEFMKNILPKYFKHNNFASFVRQLNMYGWHKVQDITTGTLKDDKNGEESWKFENPYFQKDREDLLDKIVRNKAMSQEDGKDNKVNLGAIMSELEAIKMNQVAITEDIRRIRKDNQTLWAENYITRERHQKQTQTLDKILKFLATIYGNNTAGKILEVDENNNNLDINQLTTYDRNDSLNINNNLVNTGNHGQDAYSTAGDMAPYSKPRLMLMNQAYQSSPSNKSSPNFVNSRAESTEDINGDMQNRLYQQLISDSVPSPRHYFPEIDVQSPGKQNNDVISGLEQNIYKQGQSIQQVQDWIQKLATQQQIQQQQIKIQAEREKDAGDFDVSEFLDPNTPQPIITTPGAEKEKRPIEQVEEIPTKKPRR